MIQVGFYNTLEIKRKVDFGVYLDDGDEGILLPKRFVPKGVKIGDKVHVFLYHDSDNRIIATTQHPKGIVGDIVRLKCVSVSQHGAFLDWGLMKDLFVAKSQQYSFMRFGGEYLVKIYIDAQTGRMAATEKIDSLLNNNVLTVKEMEQVDMIVYRQTDIGHVMIINNLHTGLLYFDEVYQDIHTGDKLKGYVKKIRPGNKIDVALGKPGYQKVETEAEKIMNLLEQNNGYLPFHDKSDPEDIYAFFGMSKKTFKMTIGMLYKQRKIDFGKAGIILLQE